MTIRNAAVFGLMMGVVLGLFVGVSMLSRFDLASWQLANNALVLASLAVSGYVGYQSRSVAMAVVNIALYYMIVMTFYIGSYALMTSVFIDSAAWVPFWERDYTYHAFTSVRAYMEHASNFRDLLVLQAFASLISSVMYAVAGMVGYGARAALRSRAA